MNGEQARDNIRRFIAEFHRENGYAPSLREVSKATGMSVTNAHQHLQVLRESGDVAWNPGEPRTLRVVA